MQPSARPIATLRGPWGIPIEIDGSILFLAGLLVFLSARTSLLHGVLLAVMLIGAIGLHELGHAMATRALGLRVRRIVLHGGGGFCERQGRATPAQEEIIVLAGPLMNLALWALSGIAVWGAFHMAVAGGPTMNYPLWGAVLSYLSLFGWINIALFIFNLVPVQPLDGGKLLALLLHRLFPAALAMRITGGIGFVFSVLWIPAMIWLFLTYGVILFYFPSPRLHLQIMRGERAV